MWSLISVIALLFAAFASAVSTAGNRLLVILDDVAEKDDYKTFFADLHGRGYDITYETPRSKDVKLFHLGERTFDHVLLLPTKVKALGPNLTPNLLLDFVNADGNVLVSLSSTTTASTSVVSLLSELDIVLPAERTGTVVDHFNYDTLSSPEKHDVLVLDAPQTVRPGLKKFFELENTVISFPHATGHTLGSGPLLTPILRGPDTAYSYNPKEELEAVDPEELFAAGKQLALVSTFQARNSARVTVLGSAAMLQEQWIEGKVSKVGGKKVQVGNREFAKQLSGWTFKEIGVLRVNNIEHRLQGGNETNPGLYRIKSDVSYSISISEYVWSRWEAFTVPAGDALQLEFSMLSPFHRLDLKPSHVAESETVFSTSFTLPDQHGIFNFKVNYKRPFLTNLEEKNTVSVRHIAHDEWPRSYVISGAWPWIGGVGVTVVGFVGFCVVWLYSKPAVVSGKKTN